MTIQSATLDQNLRAQSPFLRLGLPERPVILAPLAGVSDHPFRRTCAALGADLTYVEMISATALLFNSRRTLDMLKRHDSESILGVQITGKSADEVGRAVEILGAMNFETVDINMGCPVNKVVKSGCGSGILRDPERVFQTVKLAVNATSKPVSVKFRLGWDRNSTNWSEVSDAIEKGGAAWMTIHGRHRSEDYGDPVDLEAMAALKKKANIPVIGNGNIFSLHDVDFMSEVTNVDGFMVSRGALGNPWIFKELTGAQKSQAQDVSLEDWVQVVLQHLEWQQQEYGDTGFGAVCMRKHLLWYAKGWPEAKKLRDAISQCEKISSASELILEFAESIRNRGIKLRAGVFPTDQSNRFSWDPKWDMDRNLDRGVGGDMVNLTQI
jgi:nifR3 family TIM-barrel protein